MSWLNWFSEQYMCCTSADSNEMQAVQVHESCKLLINKMRFLGSSVLWLHNKFLWEEVDEFVYLLTVERRLLGSSGTSFR